MRVDPPASGTVPRVTELSAGSLPIARNGILSPAKTLVGPDGVTDVSLNDAAYDTYKNELQGPRIKVRIGSVFFTDDTSWKQGMLHKRDPSNPNRWIVVESSRERLEEFYKKLRSGRLLGNYFAPPANSFKLVS